MDPSYERHLRVLNDFPVEPRAYSSCMKKRLTAELLRMADTEWAKYLLEIRICPQSKEFPIEIVLQLTQGFRLLIQIPISYPFKGPIYYMLGDHIPHAITVAQALLPNLPTALLPQLTDYLRTPKRIMLKRYLHDRLFYGGEARRATLLTSKYDTSISPYHWSPGLSIAKQLPLIQELIAEVGLTYKRGVATPHASLLNGSNQPSVRGRNSASEPRVRTPL